MKHIVTVLAISLLSNAFGVGLAVAESDRPDWVLVIHGGAGFIPPDVADDQRQAYEGGIRRAMDSGVRLLEAGGPAIDAVVEVIAILEDDPMFNAGKGAVFTADGTHELDASLMEGHTLQTGAVAGVSRVKNPIRAARSVMDQTRHVLLAGPGADRFAIAAGCEEVPQHYFYTSELFAELNGILKERGEPVLAKPAYDLPPGSPDTRGGRQPGNTVGCVALDSEGHLAAGTSTGGLNAKMPGRVGDTPIVGAGTYADNVCAVSGTGVGEQYIRYTIARRVAWLVESGQTPEQAAAHCLTDLLNPNEGGLIAVSATGEVTAQWNTTSMPRAIADSGGRREVRIWSD